LGLTPFVQATLRTSGCRSRDAYAAPMAVPEPLPQLPGALVGAYLARLGCERAPAATAESLARLHRAHLERVPFENLDIHLGVPIGLDACVSARKIAEHGRGGFCYELNGAFGALLTALGFTVELREARVLSDAGEEGRPFGHVCLIVHLEDGPLLADVGFGRAFDEPLAFTAAIIQIDTGGVFTLRPAEGGALELVHDGVAQNRILPAARSLADFADGCTYQQTSPDSIFTRSPVCTIRSARGRTTLSGLQLIETDESGREERALSRGEYGDILGERFGISLGAPQLDRLVEAAARPAGAL
jgi:N-hydroxyarylamine O-acetyltransferase